MMHGLLVVGLLFGLGFLMVVGVHSALRDLFARQLYVPHLYEDDGSSEALSEADGALRMVDAIPRDSRA